eukprot:1175740-Prorocentrum_minimum.AAC.1
MHGRQKTGMHTRQMGTLVTGRPIDALRKLMHWSLDNQQYTLQAGADSASAEWDWGESSMDVERLNEPEAVTGRRCWRGFVRGDQGSVLVRSTILRVQKSTFYFHLGSAITRAGSTRLARARASQLVTLCTH